MLKCLQITKAEADTMNSIFTEEQLNNMSRENLVELIKIMKSESSKKEQKISEKEQETYAESYNHIEPAEVEFRHIRFGLIGGIVTHISLDLVNVWYICKNRVCP